MSTAPPDMTPKGLVNDDGNYVLQHQDVYNLLKYVWTGVLLPTTVPKYQARLQISDDVLAKLQSVVKPLVAANVDAQAHCQSFKDKTYPGIVSLASDVYDYAQNAGGTTDDSYYAIIFQSIKQLGNTTDAGEKEQLKATINGLVDTQVSNINDLVTKSQKAVSDLRSFEDQTKKDQSTLTERSSDVKKKLTQELGSLDDLEADLKKYRDELEADIKEYEHDKIVACTTPTYAWCGLIGLITASIVAGIYGNKAARMAERIDEVKKLISGDEGKINDEKHVIADLNAINDGLNNVLKMIGPAIAAVQKMIGIWQSIAEDLTNLRDMVNKDVRKANQWVAPIVEKKLVAKWNTLGTAVDKYRKAAYVSDAEQTSLDDLSKQLKQQAKK